MGVCHPFTVKVKSNIWMFLEVNKSIINGKLLKYFYIYIFILYIMGNCFKSSYNYRSFDDSLIRSLNQPSLETDINQLQSRVTELETKMKILENNTQNNLKSISDDIHFINKTVTSHQNLLDSRDSLESNLNSNLNPSLNPTPLANSVDITHADITQGSIYKSVTFQLDDDKNEETY